MPAIPHGALQESNMPLCNWWRPLLRQKGSSMVLTSMGVSAMTVSMRRRYTLVRHSRNDDFMTDTHSEYRRHFCLFLETRCRKYELVLKRVGQKLCMGEAENVYISDGSEQQLFKDEDTSLASRSNSYSKIARTSALLAILSLIIMSSSCPRRERNTRPSDHHCSAFTSNHRLWSSSAVCLRGRFQLTRCRVEYEYPAEPFQLSHEYQALVAFEPWARQAKLHRR